MNNKQPPIESLFEAPEIGEHTTEVLAEMGYSADAIAALKEQGAV